MKQSLLLLILTFFIFLFSNVLFAQHNTDNILGQINNYRSIEKEKTYLHLNRSLLFKGDQLGFTAYTVNETDHTPVTSKFNLYLTITNARNEVISQEMYPVEFGIATGVIEIDSTYSTGQYTITAYTRYMKEFEEPYHFTENFQVMDVESPEILAKNVLDKIDVQFLPESGNFLTGVINNVGVIAKNHLGYGLSNAKIMIRNENREIINVINLNEFGIGKFAFLPVGSEKYIAELEYDNRNIFVDFIPEVQREGVVFSTSEKDTQLEILVRTNDQTLKGLSPDLSLTIQGKETLYNFDLEFNEHKKIAVRLPLEDLDPGINIITLFNGREQPVAERLVFNFENFNYITPQKIQSRLVNDSLQIRIPFLENIEGSLSISVLPQKTASYNRNHNILSHFLLKPYLQGSIENAGWYFTDITEKKKEELDRLLLTQGWSSYIWKRVFNKETHKVSKTQDLFEFTASIPSRDQKRKNLRYMLHGSGVNVPQVFEIPSGVDSFIYNEYIPFNGENLKISRIETNDKLVPANLNIDFSPHEFPDAPILNNSLPYLVKTETKDLSQIIYNYELLNKDAELLEEVKLFGKSALSPKERERELGHHRHGKVSVITLEDVNSFMTLADFLQSKNLTVINDPENFQVLSRFSGINITTSVPGDFPAAPIINNEKAMLFYLDDFPMIDSGMFYSYSMMSIDYIEINRTGMGSGLMGSNGSIKIYTKRDSHLPSTDLNRIQEIKIPVTYTKNRKFYVPKYVSTSNSFFQEFGIIDWKPMVNFDYVNTASINIKNPEVDFQLIIEGVTSDGDLIHSVQKLSPASN